MDLWIRRQDRRKLVKVKTIEILDHYANNTKEYVYTAININGEQFASYKSKERALEVLDEIQELLTPRIVANTFDIEMEQNVFQSREATLKLVEKGLKDISIKQATSYVYEMPKE